MECVLKNYAFMEQVQLKKGYEIGRVENTTIQLLDNDAKIGKT